VDAALPAGDNDIGNVDLEFAGTAAATNNGTASAQTLRTATASDNSAIANWGHGATAAAVPSGATQPGYRSDGGLSAGTAALTTPVICQDSVKIDTATSGNVELVALTASETIYVCAYNWVVSAAVSVQLIYGTGSACGTGETDLTGPYAHVANGGISVTGTNALMKTAAGNALCIELSAAQQVSGFVSYTKF
jgi:hypothetical protein